MAGWIDELACGCVGDMGQRRSVHGSDPASRGHGCSYSGRTGAVRLVSGNDFFEVGVPHVGARCCRGAFAVTTSCHSVHMNTAIQLASQTNESGPQTRSATFDQLVRRLQEHLGDLPVDVCIGRIDKVRSVLASIEASILSTAITDPDDLRAARRAAATPQRSRRQVQQTVERAALLQANGHLADDLRSGQLSIDQIDVIAAASRRSGGVAANDMDLINKLRQVCPDQGRKITEEWLTHRLRASDVEAAHRKRRELRSARRGRTSDDLASITLAGDDLTIDRAWSAVCAHADRMYQADGGRDRTPGQHTRTHPQRLFDAAVQQLSTGMSGTTAVPDLVITIDADQIPLQARLQQISGQPSANNPRTLRAFRAPNVGADVGDRRRTRSNRNRQTNDNRGQTSTASQSTAAAAPVETFGPDTTATSERAAPARESGADSDRTRTQRDERAALSARPNTLNGDAIDTSPQTHFQSGPALTEALPVADLDDRRVEPVLTARVAGGTALAESELARLLCDCAISVMITEPKGQPLWLSRKQRTANTAQRLALITRDGSCALCDAPHQRCEVHHIVPYNSPAKGATDLDNLVLLCGPCHRQIHEQRVTLQRNVDSLLRAASGPLPESWRESAPERSSPTQRPRDSLPSEVDQHTREPQGKRGTDDCVNPPFNDFTSSPAASGDAAGQLRPRNTAY